MRIARVVLSNWMRFEGDTTVDLDAAIYGIVAQHDGDARRSNWAGKTAFVEAIRFALFGVHRAAREDGWITHGAPGGAVRLTLTDGTVITRARTRGRATRLQVERGMVTATGDAAQDLIDRWIGFGRDDFEVTCWFGQKQMARLILARPVERFDLVSGWFGLEGLQRCEERVREHLAGISAATLAAEAGRTEAQGRLVRLGAAWGHEPGSLVLTTASLRATVIEAIDARRDLMLAAEREVNAAMLDAEAFVGQQRAADAAAELAEVREQGRQVGQAIEGVADAGERLAAREAERDAAKAAIVRAADELRAKQTLARGEFSGRCPVDASECPAKAAINARTSTNAGQYDAARAAYDDAAKRESLARLEYEGAVGRVRKRDALVVKRDELRARARRLLPLAQAAIPDFDSAEYGRRMARVDEAHRGLAVAEAAWGAANAALDELDAIMVAIRTAAESFEWSRATEHVGRAALRIFGRQGAQQRIAESALAEIERGANAILREAAIDLSLVVKWGREGVGLAAWCGECGAPFPASARVKVCERCRCERGPKVVERLDVELSDRSGAAEDLAGVALQLAAAAWLRAERGVSWSVAFLDEPFGALDEANRRGFAAHLVAMLRGSSGFEQAFVVAHHPDVIDALPARLLVRAGATASTIEAA